MHQPTAKVFVSATSQDLKSYRAIVAEWARDKGYEVVVQDEFPVHSDYITIAQMLRDKLDPCDAVIHLAGLFYGFEPKNRPGGETRRSYTQLEYELGKEHKRQVFRLIARPGYKSDSEYSQSDKQAELQKQHRQRLMQGNELYYEFSGHDDLRDLLSNIVIQPTHAKPQNLPLVGSLFKGRDEFIKQLRSVLVSKPTHIAAVTAKQAIHGLGGIGKTRVAVEYAWKFSHEYTALLFITADSPANLNRNLANLCGALVLNLPERAAREQEVQVAAALRWLREHSGWFLIVDNVDTPDAAEAVEHMLQQLDTGHVVITSRLSRWEDVAEELSLDVISETAAQEFLLERTGDKRKPAPTDDADALALAIDLGRLPLALEQAGAFIVKHRGSMQGYHDRWKKQEAKVLQWHDQRTMKYPASVATTWQTSFDLLSEDGRGLLNVLCWLAPDPIPLTMANKLTTIDDEPPIDIESGIADLADYSLLKWTSSAHDFVEVHRLVQELSRMRLPPCDLVNWLQRALRMVDDFVPAEPDCYDVRSWPDVYEVGQNHIAVLVRSADTHQIYDSTTRLMGCLAGYLKTRASHSEAEPLMRRVLSINEQYYGEQHPEVATALNNMALLLQDTNRLSEAELLMRRAVDGFQQSYGEDHPSVATVLNNLAQLLRATNRLSEAEPLMRRALWIAEQSCGEQHPTVAMRLSNLARLLTSRSCFSEAEPMLARSVDIFEKTYGKEHPDIATALINFASLLQATDRSSEAEPLIRRALSIDEQCYGEQHPNVARDLDNLAQLLQATNRLSEAEPLSRRVIEVFVAFSKATGYEHPHMQAALENYFCLLQAMGLSEDEANAKIQALLRGENV